MFGRRVHVATCHLRQYTRQDGSGVKEDATRLWCAAASQACTSSEWSRSLASLERAWWFSTSSMRPRISSSSCQGQGPAPDAGLAAPRTVHCSRHALTVHTSANHPGAQSARRERARAVSGLLLHADGVASGHGPVVPRHTGHRQPRTCEEDQLRQHVALRHRVAHCHTHEYHAQHRRDLEHRVSSHTM